MVQKAVIPGTQNRLANEPSPYLQSAAHQPVRWYPWGDEAFETARREHKPILLDIGAVWCHWCHVMDSESYENDATAGIINEHFIPVKVDRDERPEVDSRYQAAVSAFSGQGGWPLTAFLTPDGELFYGGTYFPPEDRGDRIAFPTLLTVLANAYRSEPDKVAQNAALVRRALSNSQNREASPASLSDSAIDEVVESLLANFDAEYGGFGRAPKFPHCSAIELLVARYDQSKDPRQMHPVTTTLQRMADGGIHDQLAGGFHRYSTDRQWIVPHFEKMLYDNAYLLTNYVHAFQATGDEKFRDTALDITKFVDEVLTDRDSGGFYSSQDADVRPGDDGSYFTWSLEQTKNTLTGPELAVVQAYYGIREIGQMPHDRTQNVLHIEQDLPHIAGSLAIPSDEATSLLTSAKRKMSEARSGRTSPFVDATVYAGWNGMMISSYFEFCKAFESDDIQRIAIASLNRILRGHTLKDGTISHNASDYQTEGYLDDQVQVADALLQAFELTADYGYFEKAEAIVKRTIASYADQERGGFFDTKPGNHGTGLLGIPFKPVQDSPVASANAVAISVLNKLHAFTGNATYRDIARKSLEHLAGTAAANGMYSSHFFLALHQFLHPALHVVIVAPFGNLLGKRLHRSALKAYRPGKTVAWYEPAAVRTLPEVLVGTVRADAGPIAYVCSEHSCAPPVKDEEALVSTILTFGRP